MSEILVNSLKTAGGVGSLTFDSTGDVLLTTGRLGRVAGNTITIDSDGILNAASVNVSSAITLPSGAIDSAAIGTGAVSANKIASGAVEGAMTTQFGRRNLIINGDMRINQRSWTSAAVTNAFTVDRWKVIEQTDGAITAEQSTDAPDGFGNSFKITVTSADSSLGTTQYARVQQNIEGTNIVGLAFGTASAKTITISFYVKSSLTGTFSGCVRAIGVNRSYPFTYAISSADTWEAKSVTISGDTGGAWDVSTSGGISLFLTLCSGSDYDAPAGAWETTGASAAEGGVNVLATNGATIQWTGVQLEVGAVATPFEHRSYGEELALCQRYFYKLQGSLYGIGFYYTSGDFRLSIDFPVDMRSNPTLTSTGTFRIFSNGGSTYPTSHSLSDTTPQRVFVSFSGISGTAGAGGGVIPSSGDSISLDAEL